MGTECQELLGQLEALYEEGMELLEEELFEELAPLLERRRELLSALPDPMVQGISAARKEQVRRLLDAEERFVQGLEEHSRRVQQALHDQRVRQRKLKWYESEE